MATDVEQPLVAQIRSAYEGSANGWADGPAAVYRHLAHALIADGPGSWDGRRVLDLGAGTGVASEVLLAAGARPVGLDLARAMLAHRREHRPPGVVGDACALPLATASFDAVVAAFSLNHVPEPPRALGECRRVTRAGGVVLASTFPSDADHPAKAIVESVLEEFGYERPDWYQTFKTQVAWRTGEPEAFARAAETAGLSDVQVDVVDVDAGLDRADLAVEWRLGMPHTIGFVSDLDADTRAALRARATAALDADLPSATPMLRLQARVP